MTTAAQPPQAVGRHARPVAAAIAEHVVGLRYEELPAAVVAEARAAILDTIAVSLAALGQEVGRAIVGYAQAETGCGDGVILGADVQTSCELAALVNGTVAHALDFDDRGHASTHVLGTAVALSRRAPSGRLSGRDLLAAYVAGREVRMHFNHVFDEGRFDPNGGNPGSWGWHATGVFGTFGSVATAARVLQLNAEQTTHALAASASLASGVIANFGTMTKPLHAGNAARNGVLCALLAQRGWTADPEVFTAPNGFTDAITGGRRGQDPRAVVDNLTSWFHLAEHGIRVKPYPSCSGSHPYIEATRTLLDRTAVPVERIARITLPPRPSLTRNYPQVPIETKFSGGFTVVATLLTGEVSMDTCTEEFLRRADVQELMDKVVYVEGAEPAVVIELTDGQVLREPFPKARNLDTEAERSAKFHALVDPVLGADRAAAVAEEVANLPDSDDVSSLIAACAGAWQP